MNLLKTDILAIGQAVFPDDNDHAVFECHPLTERLEKLFLGKLLGVFNAEILDEEIKLEGESHVATLFTTSLPYPVYATIGEKEASRDSHN